MNTIEIDFQFIFKNFLLLMKEIVFDKIEKQKMDGKLNGVKANFDCPTEKMGFVRIVRKEWAIIYFIDVLVTKLLYKKINPRKTRLFSQHEILQQILLNYVENKYPGLIEKYRTSMKNILQQSLIEVKITNIGFPFRSSGEFLIYIENFLVSKIANSDNKKNLFKTIKKMISSFSHFQVFLNKGFECLLSKTMNDEDFIYNKKNYLSIINDIEKMDVNEFLADSLTNKRKKSFDDTTNPIKKSEKSEKNVLFNEISIESKEKNELNTSNELSKDIVENHIGNLVNDLIQKEFSNHSSTTFINQNELLLPNKVVQNNFLLNQNSFSISRFNNLNQYKESLIIPSIRDFTNKKDNFKSSQQIFRNDFVEKYPVLIPYQIKKFYVQSSEPYPFDPY